MKIVLASSNPKKIKELREILCKHLDAELEIMTLREAGILDEIVEDGESFAENALIKARTVAARGYIGIGDDSGLTVDALGGAPGIYSARYAGEHGNDALNNQKLLKELDGVENRQAAFVCCIACVFPDDREDIVVHGYAPGVILKEAHGNGGFGYDPLFYVEEFKKTFAELTSDEKNSISHRGKALCEFAKEFKQRLCENK